MAMMRFGRKRSASAFFCRCRRFGFQLRKRFRPAGAFGDFDLLDQLVGDGIEMAGRSVLGLGNEIDCAQSQGFESGVGAFLANGC